MLHKHAILVQAHHSLRLCMTIQVPILIVGAGPTGLTAALTLRELGIDCLVIDKRQSAIKTSNALAVQPRTLELWEKLGIIEKALEEGHPLYGLNIYHNKEKISFLSLRDLKTPFPYILGLPQAETESILTHKFLAKGGKIERDLELTFIEQSPDEVFIVTQTKNKKKTEIQARWVLACDGARSLTRELLQIPFTGKDLPKHFMMADLPATGPFNPHEGHAILSPEGVMAVIPLKTFYRIIFDVTQQKVLNDIKVPDMDIFRALTKERCAFPIALGESLWSSSFWIHEHIANRYFKNRVFLLGDAAHEHSPVGGQGMNVGIQDAYNLCWKLAMVEKKQMEHFFLDSYQQERYPVAKKIVNSTTTFTNLLTTPSLMLQFLRNQFFKFILKIEWINKKFSQTISQLNIQYQKSDFFDQVGLWKAGIQPGKQMPYSPIQFNNTLTHLAKIVANNKLTLLIFYGKENIDEKKFNQFIAQIQNLAIKRYVISIKNLPLPNLDQINDKDQTLHYQYGANQPCFYLVRPDQYVSFRCNSLNELFLKSYLDKIGILPKVSI